MELSSAESALRTLTHRPKVPPSAIASAEAILQVIHDPPSPSSDETSRRDLLQQELRTLLVDGHERWEPVAVFFVVVRDLLRRYVELPDLDANVDFCLPSPEVPLYVSTIAPLSDVFVRQTVKQAVHQYMEYYEPRVRMAVAKVLGVLAKWDLEWLTHEFTPKLIDSVVSNLHRSPTFEETGFDELDDNISTNGMMTPPQSPQSTPRTPSTPYKLDDVSGWKALESSLCAFNYMIKGSGVAFLATQKNATGDDDDFVYLTPQLVDLVTMKSCFHINRHVRVVGLDTITVLAESAPLGFFEQHRTSVGDILNQCIKRGMEDNWCQVRYAASIATRTFLLKLEPAGRAAYLPTLLPRLCLNRYYIAERVQKYSQESWQLIVGTHGRDLLATKVDARAIQPHVPRLLQALLLCFYDVSNLVRDAACLASAQLVLGFPDEARPFLEEFYRLWIEHLADPIWSVREDAAIALGNVIRAYGQEALDRVVTVTTAYLPRAKTQPAMTQHEHDEKMRAVTHHMSKQAFSCCSLEPKVLERPDPCVKEPWEYTDGAIYMVRELCHVAPDVAVTFLPELADLALLRHFPQTANLQETIWTQVPKMCHALGKQVFKRHVEVFFDPLVFTLQGTHRRAIFAARECVAQLSAQIGPSIFRGRVDANPTWKDILGPLVRVQAPMVT
ncbi:hypothetical protein PsorP6_011320 [Peronosclerospora sorghi]|uniref:Uncharacterized protein n=1 Tax=Peronosclerospora sorghi TaxID=230839 RepID=A0ACC0WI89_9STRA|nr:hypothetical protein PsorP6_011320 [Peronosclerospora sorghi]